MGQELGKTSEHENLPASALLCGNLGSDMPVTVWFCFSAESDRPPHAVRGRGSAWISAIWLQHWCHQCPSEGEYHAIEASRHQLVLLHQHMCAHTCTCSHCHQGVRITGIGLNVSLPSQHCRITGPMKSWGFIDHLDQLPTQH